MAKKTSKKGTKKASKKSGSAAKKGAAKKAGKAMKKAAGKAAKAGKKAGASMAPRPIKTGRGPTPAEVGKDFVEMFNRGQFKEIEDRYWSPKVTSIEGVGVSLAWSGRKAVEAKNKGWMETHQIHSCSAEGPYVGATGFAMRMRMDVEDTTNGQRVLMDEVGVYTVENGKVVREEFMYGSMAPTEGAASESAAVEQPEAVEAMGAF